MEKNEKQLSVVSNHHHHAKAKAENQNTLPTTEVMNDNWQNFDEQGNPQPLDVWDNRDNRPAGVKATSKTHRHSIPVSRQRGLKSGRQVAKVPSASFSPKMQQDLHDEVVEYAPPSRGALPAEQQARWASDSSISPIGVSSIQSHEQRWNREDTNPNLTPATHARTLSATPAPSGPNEQYALEDNIVILGNDGKGTDVNAVPVNAARAPSAP